MTNAASGLGGNTVLATITVNNHAPTMTSATGMSLQAINENSSGSPGTLVGAILASAAGGDPISDADANAVQGIAVTDVDNTHGDWQFSIDGGSHWTPFGSPGETNARLLAADATTLVRFVPTADWFGTVSPGITFCAWDQTSGANGTAADASTVGGAAAFSIGTNSASITVNFVNRAPSFMAGPDQSVKENAGPQTVAGWATNISSSPGLDGKPQTLNFIVSTDNDALFSVLPAIDAATGTLSYTPAIDAIGTAHVTIELHNSAGTANGGQDTSTSQAFTITANGIPPIAVDHAYVIDPSASSTVGAVQGLLTNDSSVTPLKVTAKVVAGQNGGGTFRLNTDGSFTYTPTSFSVYDYATYTVTDEQGQTANAYVVVLSHTAATVWKFYEAMLDRDPIGDPGMPYWNAQFTSGTPYGQLALAFFNGPELQTRILKDYYLQYLGRAADPNGLAYWLGQWAATTPEDIQARFAASQEFTDANHDDPSDWVAALYTKILDRAYDQNGLNYWVGQLAMLDQQDGQTFVQDVNARVEVATRILKTPETYKDLVQSWYQQLLQDFSTVVSDTDHYVQELESGMPDAQVEAEFINNSPIASNVPSPVTGTGVPLPDFLFIPPIERTPAAMPSVTAAVTPSAKATVNANDSYFSALTSVG